VPNATTLCLGRSERVQRKPSGQKGKGGGAQKENDSETLVGEKLYKRWSKKRKWANLKNVPFELGRELQQLAVSCRRLKAFPDSHRRERGKGRRRDGGNFLQPVR